MIGEVLKARKNLIGMNYCYVNYVEMYGRSHVSATIGISNNIEKQ